MTLIEDVYNFETRHIYVITFKVKDKPNFTYGKVCLGEKVIDIRFINSVFLKNNDIFEDRFTFVIEKPMCELQELKGKVIELY